MREYLLRLKKSKLTILYISLILISNFLFAFFKIQKYTYAELNSLSGQITQEQYSYLSNLSRYGNQIISFIMGLGLIYFIVAFIKKDKSVAKDFLFTNILIAIALNIINYIISIISKIHSINFIEPILAIYGIAIIIFIYCVIIKIFKFKNRSDIIYKERSD